MNALRTLIFLIGTIGTLTFGSLFAISLLSPITIEKAAKEVLRYLVQKRVGERLDSIDESSLVEKAKALIPGLDARIESGKTKLNSQVMKTLDAVIDQMQDKSCECRRFLKKQNRENIETDVSLASRTKDRLTTLIQTKYGETAQKLLREFRIFTGANALVFLMLVMVPVVKRAASVHLIPAAVTLVFAALLTACLYLFGQNWVQTIIFDSYWGYSYFALLGVSAVLLLDVFLNRARVSARIVSWFGDFGVAPC